MKRREVKRGLYRRITTSTETDDELAASPRELRGETDEYIAEATRVAEAIVKDAGIDPASLFQRVDRGAGGRIDSRWRINEIDRDELPAAVDQALDILEDVELRIGRLDLADKAVRNAFWNGLRLASAVDALNANLAWEPAVRSYFNSRRQSAYLPHVKAAVKQCKAEAVKPTGAEVARRLNLSGVPISERQARDLVKSIR